MKKRSVKLLVLSCLFITVSLALLVYEIVLLSDALAYAYDEESTDNFLIGLVVAIGNLYTFLIGVVATMSGAGSIPFAATLMHREGKKWFTILLVVTGIILTILPILSYLSMSAAYSLNPVASASSSSTTSYQY